MQWKLKQVRGVTRKKEICYKRPHDIETGSALVTHHMARTMPAQSPGNACCHHQRLRWQAENKQNHGNKHPRQFLCQTLQQPHDAGTLQSSRDCPALVRHACELIINLQQRCWKKKRGGRKGAVSPKTMLTIDMSVRCNIKHQSLEKYPWSRFYWLSAETKRRM